MRPLDVRWIRLFTRSRQHILETIGFLAHKICISASAIATQFVMFPPARSTNEIPPMAWHLVTFTREQIKQEQQVCPNQCNEPILS